MGGRIENTDRIGVRVDGPDPVRATSGLPCHRTGSRRRFRSQYTMHPLDKNLGERGPGVIGGNDGDLIAARQGKGLGNGEAAAQCRVRRPVPKVPAETGIDPPGGNRAVAERRARGTGGGCHGHQRQPLNHGPDKGSAATAPGAILHRDRDIVGARRGRRPADETGAGIDRETGRQTHRRICQGIIIGISRDHWQRHRRAHQGAAGSQRRDHGS